MERFERGEWHPAPLEIVSVGGQRGGATVEFVLRFEGPAGHRLKVEGLLEINPQATLIEGRWSEEGGSTAASGRVSSSAIDFFGGQGGRPSLGGQFTLSTAGVDVYRINLPATLLTADR